MIDPRRHGGEALSGLAPVTRSWGDRIDDPDEPLFTIAVVSDLLGTDHQTLRRLEHAIDLLSSRPSGNQRRYSRRDVQVLSDACVLNGQGLSPSAVAKVINLQRGT